FLALALSLPRRCRDVSAERQRRRGLRGGRQASGRVRLAPHPGLKVSHRGVAPCRAPQRPRHTSATPREFAVCAGFLALRTCLHAWHRATPLWGGGGSLGPCP